jgi:hypothetical protein
MNTHSSFLAQSFKASFAADDSIAAASHKTPDATDDLLPQPEDWLKSERSSLHVSTGVFGASRLAPPALDDTEASRMAPSFDLTETSIVQAPVSPKLGPHPDPFARDIQLQLLSKLVRPVSVRHGYKRIEGRVPSIRQNSVVSVSDVEFMIMECKGEGGFGKVFKALMKDGGANPNETIANIDVVLKLQKPPREWEFYICTELHDRY